MKNRRSILRRTAAVCMALICLCGPALADVVKLPIDQSGGLPYRATFSPEVMVYEDPSIRVERFRVQNSETPYNCYYHYCTVTIADASQLRTAAASSFPRLEKRVVQETARKVNAVVAINGDYYGSHEDGFILRQGEVYRDRIERPIDLLLIDEDGDFHVIFGDEEPEKKDKTEWEGKKIINAFSFGPALIVDDRVTLNLNHDPARADAPGRGQRSVIVQTGPLSYLLLTARAVGVSLEEMVELIQSLTDHVEVAYMLDGGESSQLVFLGALVNKPAKNARAISDIIYFASAWDGQP